MGAKRFEDLIAWQRARDLEREVFAFTATLPAVRDGKYCDQIRESSRSATRNTAEGFGRYYPREFSRFLRIAAASLHETMNQLHHALDRGYLPSADHLRLTRLAKRAIKANLALRKYLAHCSPPDPFGQIGSD